MGQNMGDLLLYEGHSDLGFVGFAQFLDLLFSSTVDDITFLITSNKRMADEVHTILFMVIGKDLKFLLIHVLTLYGLYSLQWVGREHHRRLFERCSQT